MAQILPAVFNWTLHRMPSRAGRSGMARRASRLIPGRARNGMGLVNSHQRAHGA